MGRGRGGGLGVHLVFVVRCFLPSRSTLVWRGGGGGGASGHLSVACGLAPSSPPPSGGGGAGVGSLAADAFSRFSLSVDSPQFSPHVPRRENSKESSVSCSRVFPPASHALQGVARGWIGGLGHVRLALVDVAVALALSPLTVRG